MGNPVAIKRTEHSADDLRALASKCRDGAQVRRLLALALVLKGGSRTEAAKRTGMDRQTLRDWVHRYNADGVAGLRSGHGPGKPPALTAAQMAALRATVLQGPDPEKHGVVRWRCVDGGRPPLLGQSDRADHREMVTQAGPDAAATASVSSEER